MNDSLAKLSGMDMPEGIYVQEVDEVGAGVNLGMAAGDVVLAININRVNLIFL